jgi:ATP-binding cassette subfamily B protein
MARQRRVLSYLRPYRLAFLFAFLQVVLIGALELLKPWPLKVVIDHVLQQAPVPWAFAAAWSTEALLLSACSGLVLIYLSLAALAVLNNHTTIGIGQRMVNDLRRDLYMHLQRLSLGFHRRQEVGELLYRVTADTYSIQTLTMNGLFPILSALILLVGMFVVMVRMDVLLAVVALGVCPLLLVSIALLGRRITAAATDHRQRESAVYSLVQRAMSSMPVIQAFTKEEEEHRKFMAASEKSLAAGLRLYTVQTVYSGAVNVLIAVGTAVVVWVGARQVLAGRLSVGDLVVFTSYLASLYAPINSILQTFGLIQGARVGVRRVFEILDVERDLKDGKRAIAAGGVEGDLTWNDVSFAYLPQQPVLQHVSLHVSAGERVAIVGPTGAGKSTLLGLLPRFYDPQAGLVVVDGVDVRELRLADLRRQISMVLQPPLVFPCSIRENIAYSRPQASIEEVMAAARLACIDAFIASLPQGYETVIGEQGATLSEGEKQRLTIARAILRNASILILDEPTSSIDAETEALIMEGLRRLTEGKTTLIIAHRLSTVRQADRIVVLRQGRIVEQGSFAELMRHQGAFAALYQSQFRGEREGQRAVS